MRHFNLDAVGGDPDGDSGEQWHPFPRFMLSDLLAITNYKKTLAFRFRLVVASPIRESPTLDSPRTAP
jgi:hypothetical protein